jgi:tetratricopeptide (TPR) repeat protein
VVSCAESYEPGDWLRREIEYALDSGRNIIPVLVDGFKFNDAEKHLTDKLVRLKDFQAQPLYTEETELYEVGLDKLANQKLKLPVYIPELQPVLPADEPKVEQIIQQAVSAPTPTQEELTAEQYFARAFSKVEVGDMDGAIADYTEAIRLNPEFATAYSNRGVVRYNKGDMDGAIVDYIEAIRLNPDYADAYSNQAEAYFALSQYDKALTGFQKANQLDSKDHFPLAGLAITHHALGNTDEAKRLWMGLIEQDARYRDVEWVRKELNWTDPLVEAARKLIAEL